jgi:ribosome-associated heat shock protein Hsp15
MDSIRIDRWLSAARIYKSRSMASDACIGGHVQVNGVVARASQLVRIGDRVVADVPRGKCVLDVLAIADRRQAPAKARDLYADHSPPPPPRDERVAPRLRGSGRPTKADRRALGRLVGR